MLALCRGLFFYASFCLPLTIIAEVSVYKQGNGGSEWLSTCPRSLSEYALGYKPGSFCLQRPGSCIITTLHNLTLCGWVLCLLSGHLQNLFMLGPGGEKRGCKGLQLVLPGPDSVILDTKRYSVPPPGLRLLNFLLPPVPCVFSQLDQMKQSLCVLHSYIAVYMREHSIRGE